jgi:SagB-type dehydrogenase family enzyme
MEQRPAEVYRRLCRQRAESDWEHAPLPFKLYRDCPRIPLGAETLEALSRDGGHAPSFSPGLLLHDIYGMVRVIHQAHDVASTVEDTPLAMARPTRPYSFRLGRVVASGGALYPTELYLLVGPGQSLAAGLYHYDPAHHALDRLRAGDFTHTFLDGLAEPPRSRVEYALLFSAAFWKDAFKYQEFSYRLQGLDIGCLLAQAQLVAEQRQLEPTLHYRFVDQRMNHLLGLDSLKESVYAIMTFEGTLARLSSRRTPKDVREASSDTIDTMQLRTLEQYEPLSRWPLLEAVHRASQREARTDLYAQGALAPIARPVTSDLAIELPAAPYRYARSDAGRRRSSWPVQFRPRPLPLEQLALLLQVGHQGYRGDLGGETTSLAHTLLYCVINHVEGLSPGIYRYEVDQEQHRRLLRLVRAGEFHQALQAAQIGSLVNAANLSLCIIPVGDYAAGFSVYGDRWYRMQNMEAGMIAQRLYLAGAARGLGCRANLTYRDEATDSLLALPEGYTSLIQFMVSPVDAAAQEGGRCEIPITW